MSIQAFGSETYVVQDVIDVKLGDANEVLYRVRWFDTWEPRRKLNGQKHMLNKFDHKLVELFTQERIASPNSPSSLSAASYFMQEPCNSSASSIDLSRASTQQEIYLKQEDDAEERIDEMTKNNEGLTRNLSHFMSLDVKLDAAVSAITTSPHHREDDEPSLLEDDDNQVTVGGVTPMWTPRDRRLYKGRSKCAHCSYVGPYSVVRVHERTHTIDKPYSCDLCGQRFKQPHNVRVHVKEVHQRLRRFGCRFCGRTFTRNSSCKDHIRRFHANELGESFDMGE